MRMDIEHGELLARIERYYDAVPRARARAEEHGPLTLFVREGPGWPYYARPRPGETGRITAEHVRRVRQRQRELGVPESFEWVTEVTPSLRQAAEAAGLTVAEHPLMVLADPEAWRPLPAPEGVEIRLIDPDAPDLATVLAVAALAFVELGTQVGRTGRETLVWAAAEHERPLQDAQRERLREGLSVTAAAYEHGYPLAVGTHQPVGDVTEIVGVATLPAERRRGLGSAVTSRLVQDALARGCRLVFLTATDEDVARVYARVGFRRIGTALIAEPPGVA